MSTRHPLTTGATGHAGRPFLSSHDRRAGSRRYRPRSVPTHTRPPESAASARTRFAHSAPGDEGGQRVGVGNSVHRSEERRVGKECRCRWSTYHYKKHKNTGRSDMTKDTEKWR